MCIRDRVNISWFFDRGSDLSQAFGMMKNAVTRFDVSPLFQPGFLALADGKPQACLIFLGIVLAGCVLLFIVSLREECQVNVAAEVLKSPCVVRFGVVLVLLLSLPLLGADPVSYTHLNEEFLSNGTILYARVISQKKCAAVS